MKTWVALWIIISLLFSTTIQAETVKQLMRGEKISEEYSLPNGWKWVPEVKAKFFKKFKKQDGAQVISKKPNFVFYKERSSSSLKTLSTDSNDVFPVVYQENSAKLGVITGSFTLHLRDQEEYNAILVEHGLRLVLDRRTLGFVVAEAERGVDIGSLYKDLLEDKRIKKVHIEIL